MDDGQSKSLKCPSLTTCILFPLYIIPLCLSKNTCYYFLFLTGIIFEFFIAIFVTSGIYKKKYKYYIFSIILTFIRVIIYAIVIALIFMKIIKINISDIDIPYTGDIEIVRNNKDKIILIYALGFSLIELFILFGFKCCVKSINNNDTQRPSEKKSNDALETKDDNKEENEEEKKEDKQENKEDNEENNENDI